VIAVLGATGTIGAHVAARLAELPVDARALVRDPSRSACPLPVVAADLLDAGSLRAALEGATALFLLTPHGPDQARLEVGAIDAAADAGVGRIVKLSGGAPSLGPNGPTPTAVVHWRSERRIEDRDLRFCFLRASFLMQNLLTTVAPVVRRAGVLMAPMGDAPIAMVDARDVAACAVAALTDDALPDGAWHLTGPRAVTFREVAAALSVPYVKLPPRIVERALRRQGAGAWEIDHALRMAAYFAAGADAAPTDAVARLTGRGPRPVHGFLAENAPAFGGTEGRRATAIARLLSLATSPKGT
jgi:uncharacterized protein YbjT (DUF2867 family)